MKIIAITLFAINIALLVAFFWLLWKMFHD